MRVKISKWIKAAFVLTASALSVSSYAQFRVDNLEFGLTAGPTVFLGDVGGNKGEGKPFLKDFDPQATTFYYGGYLQYYVAEWLGVRLQLGAGDIKGSDSYIGNSNTIEVARIYRNLSFRSSIQEALLMTEIYPTYFFEQTEGAWGKFRPYATIGVGFLKFNPQGLYKSSATDPGTWVDLQPLRTEGQGIPGSANANKAPYKLNTLVIPMGLGMKYYFSDAVGIGVEVLHRKTFTDYLDDISTVYPFERDFDSYFTPQVSTIAKYMSGITSYKPVNYPGLNGPDPYPREGRKRGNPKHNDAFFSINFRLSIRLGNGGVNDIPGAYYYKRCPGW